MADAKSLDFDDLVARAAVVAPARAMPRTSFVAWCLWLGVALTPGQRVLCSIAYDGLEPENLAPEDRAIAEALFGTLPDVIPRRARATIAAVCGGRGGKSYVLIALRLVFGALTRDLKSLAPGQKAVALIIAPNDKLRREVVAYALGAMRSKPELKAMLVLSKGKKQDDALDSFGIRRPDGHLVTFEAGVAARGGYGGRGRSLTDFAQDESAFFRDSAFQVNDAEIFKAASPRVLPGGQSIIASTPWAEAGLLYDLYSVNWGKPSTALVAHAPTLVMQNNQFTQDIVSREYERDPDNAEREFGAKFMKGGTTLFFEPTAIEAAIDLTITLPRKPLPGETVASGGDFGFRSDSSALVVNHQGTETIPGADGKPATKTVQRTGEILELRPEKGVPLKPSETVGQFAARMKWHGSTYVMADQHYRESIDEHLVDADLAYVPAPNTPADAYMRARAQLRQQALRIPNHARLIQQLKEIRCRPLPGGGMSIVSPRWKAGGHGDIASAWVLAVYQLAGDEVSQPPKTGSKAWEDEQREQRRKACLAAETQKDAVWWKARGSRGAPARR